MTSKNNEELENDNNVQEKANGQKEDIRPVCGLIMPIADILTHLNNLRW